MLWSYPMLMPNAPPRARLLPPGPSSSQARRATMPFRSRIRTFCHPQGTLLISRQSSREIGFRVVAKLVGTVLVLSKTPKPDGSECQCSPFLSGISLSGNRHIRCRGSLAPQNPEPRTPMRTCDTSLPRRLLSLPSGIA
jgi:hypothetical protein